MKTPTQYAVVIVAGGKGLRLGADIPKQFLPIAHKPMLMHTIEKFYHFDQNIQIVVVLHQHYIDYWKELCLEHTFDIPCELIAGGETRFHSVKNGLQLISDDKIVGIHDAARPFVSEKLIAQCYHYAGQGKCGVIPVVDQKNSLRQIEGLSHKPLDRSGVKIVQTPQVFPAHLIKASYETSYDSQLTDDATVAEKAGVCVNLIQGEEINIKITTSADMKLAEFLLKND